MKKLYTQEKWKRYSSARARAQAKASVRFRKYTRGRNADAAIPQQKRFQKSSTLQAPAVLSFLQNPNETILFINKIKILSKDRNVFVDLADVQVMTPEAIACLIAMIHRFESLDANISGNVPRDPAVRSMIEHSGFRDYVRSDGGWMPARALLGKVRKRSRSQETVQNRYNQTVTNELITFATQKLTGTAGFNGPSYNT